MKKIFLLSAVVAALTITTSCSRTTVEVSYFNDGFPSWYSDSFLDMITVQNYITGLGIPYHDITNPLKYTGSGRNEAEAREKADKEAKKIADEWVAKIKTADIDALNLHEATKFRWQVRSDIGTVIAEFSYKMD
ncbi:MAG: hypothetical protein FWE63_00265 [Bacteroidales bacterium]|nr:hypothetical protein [Bacteroidales bacterium]